MEKLIMLLAIIFVVFLLLEAKIAKKNRNALKHVVYVNGTRGKSSVTRLIDGALRVGGYKVFCKTTGTVPSYIDVNNNEHIIKRRGKANIKEQLWVLKKAAQQQADILVCECMAVDPLLQKISQHKMVKADIGVITNVRLDHTEEMGETLEEICYSLSNTIPANGVLFTAEKEQFSILQSVATTLNSKCFLADLTEPLPEFNFAENLAVALMVAQQLGVEREIAINGMLNFKRDPFDLSVHRFSNGAKFINAMSANDIQSTVIIYNQMVEKFSLQPQNSILLINNRADRGYRTNYMIDLTAIIKPKEIWLIGSHKNIAARKILKAFPSAAIKSFNKVEEIPFATVKGEEFVLAVGNIANFGEEIMEYVAREGVIIG